MNRRRALTIAGSTAMVVAAGGIAMAANFGVLGVAGAGTDPVGTLDSNTLAELTTTTQPAPDVVVIDQYDLAPPPPAATAGADVVQGEPDDEHGTVVEGTEPRVEQPSTPPASSKPPTTADPAPTTTHVESRHDDDDHEVEDDEHETEHEDD